MTGQGYNKLLEHEGEKLSAYYDSEGYLTIGCGHLIDARKGGGISQKISRIIFDDDIANAQMDAANNFSWFRDLNSVRQDVIVMLIFNMGLEGLKTFHRMIEAIEARNFEQAAWELSNSQWKLQVSKDRHDELTDALEYGNWNTKRV